MVIPYLLYSRFSFSTTLMLLGDFLNLPFYIHFPNYFIVWKRGNAITRLIDFKFGTVERKLKKRIFPRSSEWVGYLNNYKGKYEDTDYILVKGEVPNKDKQYFKNFTIIKSKSDWFLYERVDKAD